MLKVGEIVYSEVFQVTDDDGNPITTLVNADFTKVVYNNGVVIASPTITVAHLSSGNYQVQLTPDAQGQWNIIITQATYYPDGWTDNYDIRLADADLEYTGALCTLAEVHDELNIPDSITDDDVNLTRLISSISSQIIERTATEFISKTVTDEYHNIEEYQNKVFLNHFPIFTVTSVYEDGTALTYTSNPQTTDYHINDGHIEKADGGYFTAGSKRLKVTYVAFKTVPYEIKEVAIQMVAIQSGKKKRTFIDEEGITQAVTLSAIPKKLYDILDRYRRIKI